MNGNSSATANGSSSLEIAQSNQDLIMTKAKRKKRTWIIVGVISAIVIGLIVAAIILLAKHDSANASALIGDQQAITLDDLLHGRLNVNGFNGTWVSDTELTYRNSDGDLILYNVATNSEKVLLTSNDTLMSSAIEFKLSSDKKYLLVSNDYVKIYRHSFKAKYTIIDLKTDVKYALSGPGFAPLLQLVEWSPVGNALAFVYENNIYYKSDAINGSTAQITNGGNFIYNGIPDWVYEEEVVSSNKALWFSPDGKRLAFARYDDTAVPTMVVPVYGEPGNPFFLYPRANIVKYPKAGTPNPNVSLHVIDLDHRDVIKKLDPPNDFINKEPILSTVQWANSDTLVAIWMNRIQNEAAIVSYKTVEPFNTEIVKNLQEPNGWLELFTAPKFSKDGSKMIMILSQDQGSNLGGYRHVVLIERKQKAEIESLTKGSFVVTEILAWDEKNDLVYYLANTVNDSSIQHLYSVSIKSKITKCLSCSIKSSSNNICSYNSADFSTDHSYYTLNCAGPDVPSISIYEAKSNQKVKDWELNESLQKLIKEKPVPRIKKMTVDIADGFQAQVILRLPPNLDESGKTKYPLLINVYGGPDSFQVTDRFGMDWGTYLTANKSIIYGTIDGRGSGLKGDKILFAGYRRLGTVEIVDQINTTRLLQQKLPYIDQSRTGIWGWSYGGYAAGMALATDTEGVFKCGISVAPVTDWALYDSIYTERFMDMPQRNGDGYKNAQLFNKYKGLKDKQYFLIHGTYDDNVHYQQSMLWAKVLEQNDILFRQLSYPDEDHSLIGVRHHFYHSLENFLDECFIDEKDRE